MNKRTLRLTALCSLITFAFISMTMIVVFIITLLLYKLGFLGYARSPEYMMFVIPCASIAIGTVIGHVGSKRLISPIVRMSEATKEIAKGNYKVDIKEDSMAREVNTMARNFKNMADELSNKETIHNDFINNVSHEFKTPLAAIEGYVTLLQSKSLTDEKRAAYTDKIFNNTRRLSKLSGNILMLSQLENQEEDIEKEWYSLDEQIRQSLLLLEPKWSRKNIELDIDMEPVNYYGNSDLMSMVWKNIIENAINYSNDGGVVKISLSKENDTVIVNIVDNGTGMGEDVVKRVFEKFYQGDTSHSSQGNGLGLALAKRIVSLHNGDIEVSSEVGKGTIFTVMLRMNVA